MKKFESEMLNLTYECLSRYWQKDYMFIVSYCAEQVIWCGARQDEFLLTRSDVAEDFRFNAEGLQPCHLLNAEFYAQSNASFCVVTGNYRVVTDETADFFLQAQQRCTFVWEKTKEGPRIRHMHVSNPIGEMKMDGKEAFPNKMGKMAYRYMMNEIQRRTCASRISAYGTNGSLTFFELPKVLFISALGKESVVQTADGKTFVKNSISDLQKQAGDALIAIHRSYLVNPEFIRDIRRYTITLKNGTELPVPQRKYDDLRQKLATLYQTVENS
ncbi:MAG: LytTR family transcriptional regulator [Lachnospiraceae bacterium]